MRQSRIPAILFLFGFWGFLFPALASAAILQAPLGTKNANNSGLVGYWSFDGKDVSGATAYDRSGQGNNGAVNLFDSGVYKPGKIGQGLCPMCNRFLGLGFLDAGSPASLDNLSTKTFSAWIRPKDLNTYQGIASKGSGISGWHFWFRDWNSQASPKLQFYTVFSGGSGLWQTATNTDLLNEWVHVAISYDNTSDTNDPIFYINGIATTTVEVMTPSGTVAGDGSGTFYVGYTPVGGGSMRGSIDEARIYNRILTPAEIKAAYNLGTGKIRSSAGKGKTPTTRTVDSTFTVGDYTSMAMGADGFPIIAYYAEAAAGADLKFLKCNDPYCLSTITRILDAPGNVGWHTSIKAGSDGFPVISYFDQSTSDLRFAKCGDASCTTTLVATSTIDGSADGSQTSIAIGRDGLPVIAYMGGSNLQVKKCNDLACSSPISNTPVSSIGGSVSLAIGQDGFPVISYSGSITLDLKFAKCNDAACSSVTTRTLDSGIFISGTSIAIGRDGFPFVVYKDQSNGNLKFVKCRDVSCASVYTRNLDSSGVVGLYSSAAVGMDGYPILAYKDETNSRLKMIKCNDASCGSYASTTAGSSTQGDYAAVAVSALGPVVASASAFGLTFTICGSYCGTMQTIGKTQTSLVPQGLVGYWSFNGPDFTDKVYDRSGQNNHGYFIGGATSSAKTIGRVGQGVRFVRGSQVAQVSSDFPSLRNLAQKTISAWIHPKTLGEGNTGDIVNKQSIATGDGWRFAVGNGSTPNLRLEYTWDSASGIWDANMPIRLNEWQHVAVVYDNTSSTNDPVFYINGVSATSTEISAPSGNVSLDTGLRLGVGNIDGFLFDFDGTIDEVRIYNRILSPAEIRQLYGAGR